MIPKIKTRTLRGLFEKRPEETPMPNMLRNFTDQLNRSRFDVAEYKPWQAGFAGYDDELKRVSDALADEIRGDLFSIWGFVAYSGGSHVLKRALQQLTTQEKRSVRFAVFCADPSQPTITGKEDRVKVYGSTRSRAGGIYESETLWLPNGTTYVCDANDPICFTPDDSPLHVLATYLTSHAGGINLSPAQRARMRAASFGKNYSARGYAEAVDLFNAYAFRGNHQRPYPALLQQAGRDINFAVTR